MAGAMGLLGASAGSAHAILPIDRVPKNYMMSISEMDPLTCARCLRPSFVLWRTLVFLLSTILWGVTLHIRRFMFALCTEHMQVPPACSHSVDCTAQQPLHAASSHPPQPGEYCTDSSPGWPHDTAQHVCKPWVPKWGGTPAASCPHSSQHDPR